MWHVHEIKNFGQLCDTTRRMKLFSVLDGEGYKILARKNIWSEDADAQKKIDACFPESNLRFKDVPDASYSYHIGTFGDEKFLTNWYEINGAEHLKKLFFVDSMTELIVTQDLSDFSNYFCQINFFDRDILGVAFETSDSEHTLFKRLIKAAEDIYRMDVNNFAVCKYDPAFRDEKGAYQKDEWTDFCDIGKTFEGKVFTEEEYYETESRYVDFALELMRSTANEFIFVDRVENYKKSKDCLEAGQSILAEEFAQALRKCLRGEFWCAFTCKDFVINVGYDYYLHIENTTLNLQEITAIAEKFNLFVREIWN